jgi:hypothetical protein
MQAELTRLRRNARGRNDGIREELAAGVISQGQQSSRYVELKLNRALFVNGVWSMMAPTSRGRIVMRQVTTATDRIDYWIRRRIVPCDALLPGNANPSSDRYVGFAAIGRSLREQYDALAAPLPPNLAALVKRLEAQ